MLLVDAVDVVVDVGGSVVVAAVVVGSDVNINAPEPTGRLYRFLQHILHSKCLSHGADSSCIMFMLRGGAALL